MQADEPDEPEALVDRQDEVLRLMIAERDFALSRPQPVGHQRLDVRRQAGQHRVGAHDLVPGVERQQRLGGTGRARIDRDHPPGHAALVEEGHLDRDEQAVPLRRAQLELRQRADRPRHAAEARMLAGKEHRAGLADADQPARPDLDQMLMP